MKYISFLLMLLTVSCAKNDLSDADLYAFVSKANMEYWQNKDTTLLVKVHDTLKYNREFREHGLTANNYFTLYPVFFNLKKFGELDRLLAKENGIPDYTRLNARNIARFYSVRHQNSQKAKTYIADNLKRIKDTISKSPKDSLLYLDYFMMRMYLKGKGQALKEIDSMQTKNLNYSKVFYDAVLKDPIQSYPDDF